jgi:hypothetical protein
VDTQTNFRTRLVEAGILFPTGIDGLWGRNGAFERIYDGLDRAITAAGAADNAEVMRFPPAMAQATFERSGYMKNFPHFAGTVHSFEGDDRAHYKLMGQMQNGEDWMENQKPSGVVLSPAACYSVYPLIAKRGVLPAEGRLIDVLLLPSRALAGTHADAALPHARVRPHRHAGSGHGLPRGLDHPWRSLRPFVGTTL